MARPKTQQPSHRRTNIIKLGPTKNKREIVVVDTREKDFLTMAEMDRLLTAAKGGRHGTRDHLLMLLAFRHAFRVSELIDVRIRDLDLEGAHLYGRDRRAVSRRSNRFRAMNCGPCAPGCASVPNIATHAHPTCS